VADQVELLGLVHEFKELLLAEERLDVAFFAEGRRAPLEEGGGAFAALLRGLRQLA